MTSSEFRLVRLTIESFRGFRDPAELNLDGTVVVFTGPNGTGKTSVFDALQWVLLGTLERLEKLRGRKNVEHIVNIYRPDGKASVALDIVAHGTPITVRRRGDYGSSTLEIRGAAKASLFGDEATDWLAKKLVSHDHTALPMVLATCGLLQQDVMRSVLEAKAADRYAHIGVMLGLAELEAFERAAQDAAKFARDRYESSKASLLSSQRVVDVATLEVERLRQRATRRASVEVVRALLKDRILEAPSNVRIKVPDDLPAGGARSFAAGVRGLSQGIAALLARFAALRHRKELLAPPPSTDQVEQLREAVSRTAALARATEAESQEAAARLALAERASAQLEQLAATVIPLLGDRCPVCGQPIDPGEVEAHLREGAGKATLLLEGRRLVGDTSQRLAEIQARGKGLQEEYSAAQELITDWEDVKNGERALRAQVSELTQAGGVVDFDGVRSDEIDRWGPDAVLFLERIASGLETYVDALTESQGSGEVQRAESELGSARATGEERRMLVEQLSVRASRAKELAGAVKAARVAVTDARFAAIEPLVSDIYHRLDPHPTFKTIGFRHDVYYGKGTSNPVVSDSAAAVEADPLIVFSASQANIAALSYFLAMSLGAGERALPFVLLDDPLQSMDDVNALGFADLCRFLKAERQLVLSTHDRRFANLLSRKLAPRAARDCTIIHNFTGWDRRGPYVETERLVYDSGSAQLRLLRRPA